jgi:protein-tyrosine-phosphatase
MQAGFAERRLSTRSKVSQRIRIRPIDPRHPEKICTTANQSQTGLYFMTATGNYFPGMEVFVTRNFQPDDPINREEKAAVVRVESLGSGHVGVAIHHKSLLPKHVLFVCIGNACRSPMAEALARHLAADAIAASSAGLAPLGYVSPPTRAVLAEIGISTAGQKSKQLREKDVAGADLLINMTGRPGENIFHTPTPVEDWNVADPFGCDLAVYRSTRDEIERRVTQLAKRLRASAATS